MRAVPLCSMAALHAQALIQAAQLNFSTLQAACLSIRRCTRGCKHTGEETAGKGVTFPANYLLDSLRADWLRTFVQAACQATWRCTTDWKRWTSGITS